MPHSLIFLYSATLISFILIWNSVKSEGTGSNYGDGSAAAAPPPAPPPPSTAACENCTICQYPCTHAQPPPSYGAAPPPPPPIQGNCSPVICCSGGGQYYAPPPPFYYNYPGAAATRGLSYSVTLLYCVLLFIL